MAKLDWEDRMKIKSLVRKGCANREIARLLGVTEGTVRYHRRRMTHGATDGRAFPAHRATAFRPAIDAYLEGREEETPSNVADLHAWLVAEHDYPGSRRSVQRYVRAAFPPPPKRVRRRVETPPGAHAQVDWAEFRGIRLGDRNEDLYALQMQLSRSRCPAVVWSTRKRLLAWLWAHNEAFRRLDGVAATLRVDNEKTAVSRGAGAWGQINPAYRRYAETVRFHVDACPPRAPQAKGKVERQIRDHRLQADPRRRHWRDLDELQSWTDERNG